MEKKKEEKIQNKGFIIEELIDQKVLEKRKKDYENLNKIAKNLKDVMGNNGINPTDEEEKVFDKIDEIKDQYVNNNFEKPKQIDKQKKKFHTKRKKNI